MKYYYTVVVCPEDFTGSEDDIYTPVRVWADSREDAKSIIADALMVPMLATIMPGTLSGILMSHSVDHLPDNEGATLEVSDLTPRHHPVYGGC